MTVVFFNHKTLLVKTFKTGSTSLHFYLAQRILNHSQMDEYILSEHHHDDNILITSYISGHEPFHHIQLLTMENLKDYRHVAIIRNPEDYVLSCFKQFLKEHLKNAKAIKVLRWLNKYSTHLSFSFFYFYHVKLFGNRINLRNANSRIIATYPNPEIIDYDSLDSMNLPYFDSIKFEEYNFRKYDFNYKIPRLFKWLIRFDFKKDYKLYDALKEKQTNEVVT